MDDLIHTRATLLQRLKNLQDQPSWQDFFDTYWGLMYNVALKGGLTGVEAQDVVQETMISIARHMPKFKYDPSIGSFKGWLLNMIRWRINDQLRRRLLFPEEPDADSDETETVAGALARMIDPSSGDLDAIWNAEWENNLLEAAISNVKRRFDPQKFQIFDLNVNKEWPAEKIAAAFGISVSHVYMAKHRVTEMIKDEVKRLQDQVI